MKEFIYRALAIILILSSAAAAAFAQKKSGQQAALSVVLKVVDRDGDPVSSAEVSVGEGQNHYLTDAEGRISFKCALKDMVTVSKDGYATETVLASVLVDTDTVTLTREELLAGEGDNIYLPYTQLKKRYSVGSSVTISGAELARYSSADIRNVLTGVVPGVEVTENYGQIGVSPLEHTGQYGASTAVSVTSRGRQMIYMVDDVPVQIDETPLDPEQIESITIVRDVLEKTLYGPSAADGIVYIRTKRGIANDRYLNVAVESGVNMVDRMPEYADASQYAAMNNLARNNSGLQMLYSASDYLAYQQDDPYDKLHPAVDFKSMMLKNTMSYNRASVSSGGGNDLIRYYAFLGYTGEDDIYKIGPESSYNNININANLDVKLNRYISASFGLISSLGLRKSNNYGYSSNYSSEDASSNTTLSAIEFPDIISDLNTIPPLSFPVYADNSEELESPWYAVSSQYTQNPIANILENGSYQETIRKALFNVKVDADLSFVLPGLTSMTYAAYDATNLVRLGISEDYAAYIITTGLDAEGKEVVVPQQSGSHSVKSMSSKTKLLDYFSNRFYLVEKLGYDKTFGDHAIKLGADYMITKRSQKFITEHRREINFGLDASYSYKGKYLFQAALNEHGTYSLLDCWSFSPSVGLGWVISEEDFMDGASSIDFLKLRVQAGLLNYDSATSANRDVDNYSWNNSGQKFGPYTTNQWFGSSQSSSTNRTYASMLGNPNLRLEQRKEINAGIDLTALGRRLDVSLNYYNTLYDGEIAALANVLPLVAGTSTGSLYMNYNMTRRQGAELSATWHDKVGKFGYSLGGWASTSMSRILQVDELDYEEEYRSKVGKSSTAIWGLGYMGQFESDEETLLVPQLFDDSLQKGDFKYRDMNGDGQIDDSDVCVIGDSSPRLVFGINLNFNYAGWDLMLTGTGRAFYDLPLTNSYYWNGWGDSNYSMYTMKHVKDATAPRLTYNKVNNNYKLSSYWLADGSFFKIQAVELGYSFPVSRWLATKNAVRSLRIFARGNNLLTLSGIEDCDPESLSSGITTYPLMRTVVGGVKVTF